MRVSEERLALGGPWRYREYRASIGVFTWKYVGICLRKSHMLGGQGLNEFNGHNSSFHFLFHYPNAERLVALEPLI